MRRIGRMLVLLQIWSLAAFGGAAAAADSVGEPEAVAVAPAEWSTADAELAVLSYLIAAQRADAWSAYADAMARMHADAAVLARFGLAPPEEAQRLEEARASAVTERDAAKVAKDDARAQLAERLLSAASRTLSERVAVGLEGEAASDGEGGVPAAEPANPEKEGGASAEQGGVPYPEAPLQAERAMRQECRQVDAASLLLKAGVGTAAALAEARAGCLQAELAWIDVQAERFAALLAGAPESGGEPVGLTALLGMVRERQPALYDRWVRHLKADAVCPAGEPAGTGASAVVRVDDADGVTAKRLTGCAIVLPGIGIASPQFAIRDESGDVWLPLRPYAAALGMSLEWNGAARIITLAAGDTRLAIEPGSAAIEWSGGSVEMDRAVVTVNGQSFVPAAFFRELFGLNLYWDDNVRAGWLLPESV